MLAQLLDALEDINKILSKMAYISIYVQTN